jgi:hypothetical protein
LQNVNKNQAQVRRFLTPNIRKLAHDIIGQKQLFQLEVRSPAENWNSGSEWPTEVKANVYGFYDPLK